MPLMPCPECRREISTAAPSCPNCGHPRGAAPTAAPRSPSSARAAGRFYAALPLPIRLVGLGCAVVAGFVVLGIVASFINGVGNVAQAIADRPVIDQTRCEDVGLIGTTVRVHCLVRNPSNVVATATVRARMTATGKELKRSRTITVQPHDSQWTAFDFEDASASDRNVQCDCHVVGL